MNEQEFREEMRKRECKFVKNELLPLGGYWKDAEGRCYYARSVGDAKGSEAATKLKEKK